jgi:predicted HicB family RNase H-like nuclease
MSGTLSYKGYVGSVLFNGDDKVFHGKLEDIRDLISYEGTNVRALKKAFHDAVDDYTLGCQAAGKTPEKPFKGTFNVRVRSDLHRRAVAYSTEHNMKLNNVVSEALEKYLVEN